MNEEPARERVVFSVGEFTSRLQTWFNRQSRLQDVAVSGEVSGLREFNGHLGFTLKDESAILECVLWSDKRRNAPALENGMAAVARGGVRVRPDRSGYQLIVEGIELTGIGELYAMFEKLKEKFRREGLFEPGRKRVVPPLPRRVALISARGKGMEDFAKTIERQAPFVSVEFVETRVQGVGAEIEIAAALDDASRKSVDVIVLTRGGGSYEDLFPFNLEPVVRAILRARHPVVTAIGHSGDHHLADEVADMAFGTPSLAAEHIAKGWNQAHRRLDVAMRDLDRGVRDLHVRAAQRLSTALSAMERSALRVAGAKRDALAQRVGRLERRNPVRILTETRALAAGASGRLDTAVAKLMSRKAHDWGESAARLRAAIPAYAFGAQRRLALATAGLDRNDPLSPLARGYAIVTRNGRALRDASSVAVGEEVKALLERGTLSARVESVERNE